MNLKQTSQTVPKNIEQNYCKLRKICGERKAYKPVLQKVSIERFPELYASSHSVEYVSGSLLVRDGVPKATQCLKRHS